MLAKVNCATLEFASCANLPLRRRVNLAMLAAYVSLLSRTAALRMGLPGWKATPSAEAPAVKPFHRK